MKILNRRYRLRYFEARKGAEGQILVTDWPCKEFSVKGLSRNELYKVLSFFIDYAHEYYDYEEHSLWTVRSIEYILSDKYGFDFKANSYLPAFELLLLNEEGKPIESNFYIPNVTREEVIDIYERKGVDITDLLHGDKLELKKALY